MIKSVLTFGLSTSLLEGLQCDKVSRELIKVCNASSSVAEDLSDLKQNTEGLEVVVLGSTFPEPIRMAQRIHSIDKSVSIIILAPDLELERLQQALLFALYVGDQITCMPDNDVEAILKQICLALKKTQAKRKYLRTIHQLNSKLRASNLASPIDSAIHLDKLLDYAPVGLAIVNPDSRIVAWNRKAQELTGASEREILFETLDFVFKSASSDTLHAALQQARSSLVAMTVEGTRNVRGETKSFEFTFGRIAEDQKKNLMVLFHDVSGRKQAELEIKAARDQAEAASESKTRFLANMSHEIRTPIGAILGFLDLLKQPGTTASDMQDFISTIDRNGHQLLRLIDDILDISKIEAGKVTLVESRLSLIDLLADLNSLMGFKAREKGLHFDIQFKSLIPEFIDGDSVRVRQVLSNLVGNAIKFTERGSVKLDVEFQRSILTCSVRDTGIGLSVQQAALLFEPFMQADATITRRFGGTGLGLALSKKLAILMGGDLRLIESRLNHGSTFLFNVQAKPSANSKLVSIKALQEKDDAGPGRFPDSQKQLEGMNILLVEDSPDNRNLITRYLTAGGAQIALAVDGIEGIEQALRARFDVVVMDMQMPRCGGLEATRTLRSQGYDRPIVALTAHAMEEERRRAFKAGCTDYLTKPIDKHRLIDVLSRYRE